MCMRAAWDEGPKMYCPEYEWLESISRVTVSAVYKMQVHCPLSGQHGLGGGGGRGDGHTQS